MSATDRQLTQAETRGFENKVIASRAVDLYGERIEVLKALKEERAKVDRLESRLGAIDAEIAGLSKAAIIRKPLARHSA
jgi:hypothetical protein